MFRVTLQPIGKCSVKNVSHGGLYWGVCRGTSVVSWEIGRERKVNSGAARYSTAPGYLKQADQLKSKYDAIIIGGGHNGLVAAAYLQKAGLDVCVLERRHLIGGAAVTEELVPGYKFSRASYLLSLLRPQVVQDLELKKFGLKVYIRDPNSYTPLLEEPGSNGRPRSLLLGRDKENNVKQISQFSTKDAQSFLAYEEQLDRIVEAIDPLLDSSPVHLPSWLDGTLAAKGRNWSSLKTLLKSMKLLKTDTTSFYELMTAPASKVLDKWFESEPLKATLATDSVIGAMTSPYNPGSGYVLLHHVMGELEGIKGAWGYVEGGMGAVSESIARSACSKGANIFVNMPVSKIDVTDSIEARGVVLEDGREIRSDIVLSNATAKVTYLDLIKKGVLAPEFTLDVSKIDFTSPVTKINMAVNKLPNFLADPNDKDDKPKPHHRCTIHLNCEHSEIIHQGYLEATQGKYSSKAVIEMTVPSSLDPTIAPPGCHVVQLFTQYTPYTLANGQEWTEQLKNEYADKVFDDIEQYAPGFKESVVGRDILTPPDLERVFGLTGGNIFHGSMSLDQLYFSRPTPAYSDYRSPVKKLYMCGSSAHPGGGVMGAPGRLGAMAALQDWKRR